MRKRRERARGRGRERGRERTRKRLRDRYCLVLKCTTPFPGKVESEANMGLRIFASTVALV